jgi:hypothetical protein
MQDILAPGRPGTMTWLACLDEAEFRKYKASHNLLNPRELFPGKFTSSM